MSDRAWRETHKRLAAQWARDVLKLPFVVWDTETTGIDDDSKIVSLAAINHTGKVLGNSLINPGVKIPSTATRIHKITNEMVKDAPSFADVYDQISDALSARRWVIYHKNFDIARLNYECDRADLLRIRPAEIIMPYGYGDDTQCAMEEYAGFYGQWNDYHDSFTWKKLTEAADHLGVEARGAHHALEDCFLILEVIRRMARY